MHFTDGWRVYIPLEKLVLRGLRIEHQEPCTRLLEEIVRDCRLAPGSSHNHQAWAGGYLDHITEVMNIAFRLYALMSELRPLPFARSDALLVLFLHDIEKPWRFSIGSDGTIVQNPGLRTRAEKAAFREAKLAEYGITLTPEQRNAFTYVEGEIDDYSSERRVMNELAAFCHMCDVASARIWHAHPTLTKEDSWWPSRRDAVRHSNKNTAPKK